MAKYYEIKSNEYYLFLHGPKERGGLADFFGYKPVLVYNRDDNDVRDHINELDSGKVRIYRIDDKILKYIQDAAQGKLTKTFWEGCMKVGKQQAWAAAESMAKILKQDIDKLKYRDIRKGVATFDQVFPLEIELIKPEG